MEKAKAAVSDFISKSGHHDTTVHESVDPSVEKKTINPHQREERQIATDREVHQDHYHTTVQPVHDREVLPEQHHHNIIPVEHRTHDNRDTTDTDTKLRTAKAQFKDEEVRTDMQHTSQTMPTVAGEHVHHHIHETIQPVVHKETIEPHIMHTTVPIHEVHHNKAQHHAASALPAMSMDEFKKGGGSLMGREERVDHFKGEPKNIGHSLAGGSAGNRDSGFSTGSGTSGLTGGRGITSGTTAHHHDTTSHHHHGAGTAAGVGVGAGAAALAGDKLSHGDHTGTTGSGLTGTGTTGNQGMSSTTGTNVGSGSNLAGNQGLSGTQGLPTGNGHDTTSSHRGAETAAGVGAGAGAAALAGPKLTGSHNRDQVSSNLSGSQGTTGSGLAGNQGNTGSGLGSSGTSSRGLLDKVNDPKTHTSTTTTTNTSTSTTGGASALGENVHGAKATFTNPTTQESALTGSSNKTGGLGEFSHRSDGQHPTSVTGSTLGSTSSKSSDTRKPSLLDRLNPKKDADGDGKAGFMS